MNTENELEKIYNLRQEQVELKDDKSQDGKKKTEQINKQTERLLNQSTKAGQARMNEIMVDAEKENLFREEFNKLVAELKLGINWQEFKENIENDRRYIAMKVDRPENDAVEKRFLKVLKPNFHSEEYERDQNAFIREMQTMAFLKDKTDLPVLNIIKGNDKTDKLLYNLTETLPDAPIGFIHSADDIKKMKAEHAKQIVNQLFKLNEVRLPDDINKRITDIQDPFEHYEGYMENVWNLLDNKEEPDCTEVRPIDGKKDENGNIESEIYINVLARRFGLSGNEMRNKVTELMKRWEPVVTQPKYNKGDWYLTHGDLSPNNMYVNKDNQAQFLDWEWTGKTKNQLLALIYDYGNLRARAWNNPDFQTALDEEIKAKFPQSEEEEAGKAVVSLGTFRSHALLAGFFENYEPDKQMEPNEIDRRQKTEEAIIRAFAEAGIELGAFKG
jgi:hypothetical protein